MIASQKEDFIFEANLVLNKLNIENPFLKKP